MEESELLNKLESIFKSVLEHDNFVLTKDLSAQDVDGWDSLSHMLIITEIEKTFEIRFKLRELGKLNNLGDLIEVIMTKIC